MRGYISGNRIVYIDIEIKFYLKMNKSGNYCEIKLHRNLNDFSLNFENTFTT